jgi:hypothetical protein
MMDAREDAKKLGVGLQACWHDAAGRAGLLTA